MRVINWVKVGITSFIFIAAVVSAFYLGSRQNASQDSNAPQSAVTNAMLSSVSQAPDDTPAPVGAVRAPIMSDYDTSGEGVDHDAVMIQAQKPGDKPFVSDRFGDVIYNSAYGDGEGMGDLQHQIGDAATVLENRSHIG